MHALLEHLDFRRPVVPSAAEVAALIEQFGATVHDVDVADLRDMVERFLASELSARLGRAQRVRVELPFAFTLAPPSARGRTLLVNGFLDVLADEPDGALIVDYKSDRLEGRDPQRLVDDDYGAQRLVYALAALRDGAERVEVAYALLERPDEPVVSLYAAADAPRLERELLELASGVVESRFTPTETPHFELCADCPGQPGLCHHEPERTLQPLGS